MHVAMCVCKKRTPAVAVRIPPRNFTISPSFMNQCLEWEIVAYLIHDLLIEARDRILARVDASGSLVLAGILKTQFVAVEASRNYKDNKCAYGDRCRFSHEGKGGCIRKVKAQHNEKLPKPWTKVTCDAERYGKDEGGKSEHEVCLVRH